MVKDQTNPVAYLSEYELRHIAAHLATSMCGEDLHRLLQLEWLKSSDSAPQRVGMKWGRKQSPGRHRVEQLCQCRNAWHANKEAVGDTAGYIADIERAWRLAEEEFAEQLALSGDRSLDSAEQHSSYEEEIVDETVDTKVNALALQVRYAIIIASLNDLARNIPPALLVALVENNIWPLAQGLAYARQVPDPIQRVAVLAKLAPHTQESLRLEILQNALAAIREIEIEESQVQALLELTPYLPDTLLQHTLPLVRAMKNGYQRVIVLAKIIEYLPEPLKVTAQKMALESTKAILGNADRVDGLLRLVSHLPEPVNRETLERALVIARRLPDKGGPDNSPRSVALAQVALELARLGYYQESVIVMWSIGELDSQSWALSKIAPLLPKGLLKETELMVWTIQMENKRLCMLRALVPHLSSSEKVNDAQVDLEMSQARAIVEVVPYLPSKLHRIALASTKQIKVPHIRLMALLELTQYLIGPLKDEAIKEVTATIRKIQPEQVQPSLLTKMAPQLAELGCYKEALLAGTIVEDIHTRTAVLVGLAPRLPSQLADKARQRAISAAQKITDESVRIAILVDLSASLSSRLLKQVLLDVWKIKRKVLGERVFARLVSRLAELGRVDEAMEIAQNLRGSSQARALIGIAPYLAVSSREEMFRDILSIAQGIDESDDRLCILSTIAPHLPQILLEEALTAVKSITSVDVRASGLAMMAPFLPDYLLQEALIAAQKIHDPITRESALAGLLPRLADWGKPQEVLTAIKRIQSIDGRAAALGGLGPRLANLDSNRRDKIRPLITHGGLWWQLGSMVSSITRLDHSAERARATVASRTNRKDRKRVMEIRENLSERSLRDSLSVVRGIKSERARVEVLANLAPYLSAPLLKQALEIIADIKMESQRARAIIYLAPYLSVLLLQDAIALTRMIRDCESRARTLLAIANRTTGEQQRMLCQEALAAAMVRLLPHSPLLLKRAILKVTLSAAGISHNADGRARILDSLAPYLSESSLREVMNFARIIGDESRRLRTIVCLSPCFSANLLEQVLASVRHIEDSEQRAWTMTEFLAHSSHLSTNQVRLEALAAIRAVDYLYDQAPILLSILDTIPEQEYLPIFREALLAAQAIETSDERALILVKLLRHTDDEKKQKAILLQTMNSIRDIEDTHLKAYVLVRITPQLVKYGYTQELLKEVQAITDPNIQSVVHCGITSHLMEPLQGKVLEKTLSSAHAIDETRLKVAVLIGLLKQLPESYKGECLSEVLKATLGIQDISARKDAFKSLIPELIKLPSSTLYTLWCRILPVLATRTRNDFLSDIQYLIPVIAVLGGKESMCGVYEAIQDVGSWWQ